MQKANGLSNFQVANAGYETSKKIMKDQKVLVDDLGYKR